MSKVKKAQPHLPDHGIEHLDDGQLIDYCSSRADGNALIHVLCDRLTERRMQLQAISTVLVDAQKLLKPHTPKT